MKSKEEWKDIVGYNGDYQISSIGRVRSFKEWRGTKQRILKPWTMKTGYMAVVLTNGTSKKYLTVHRLIAKTFLNIEEGKECVNHKDGNKKNNDITNIEWCTYSENLIHAHRNGLRGIVEYKRGSENSNTKLSEEKVIEIRNKYKKRSYPQDQNGYSSLRLAREYGVSKTAILYILNGRNWKYI